MTSIKNMRWLVIGLMGGSFAIMSGEAEAETKSTRVPLKPVPIEGTRAPIEAADERTSEVLLPTYHSAAKIVRNRTDGKTFASFRAEPKLLEAGSVVLFEIRSEGARGSVARWRCVATQDVAECLGTPVKIRYLPNDQRVVLTARLKPQGDAQSLSGGLAAR